MNSIAVGLGRLHMPPWSWALVIVLMVIVLAYRSTWTTMVELWWWIETYTHAFLVPPIALWLIWRKRAVIRRIPVQPQPAILPMMALVAMAWLAGELVAVNAITQFAFVGLLVLAVPAVLGVQLSRTIVFPLAFLFFAVPFGEFAQPQMMEWTADFTVAALRFSGVPVFREGLHFVIPSGRWSVIETCSGTRYLIASFMVGSLFAYLNYSSTFKRSTFVAFSLVMPIVANWVRAYMVVMLGHLSNNRLAVGVDHLVYGWVFFGVVIFIMFALGARWADPDDAASLKEPPPLAAESKAGTRLHGILGIGTVFGVLAIVSAPHLMYGHILTSESDAPVVLAGKSIAPLGWTPSLDAERIKPHFQLPASDWSAEYVREQRSVGSYVAYYRRQDYQSKLVSSQNRILPSDDKRWHRVSRSNTTAVLGGDSVVFDVQVYLEHGSMGPSPRRLMAWQIFWVDGHWVSNPFRAKALGVLGRLRGHGDDGAAFVVYAAGSDDTELNGRLTAFVADIGPSLVQTLRKTQALTAVN